MIEWITEVINSVGYAGVAFLSALEVVIPIIPSEVVLPFSGFAASQGDMNLVGVILAATAGSTIGSLILYYFAQFFGWKRLNLLVDRWGSLLGVKSKDLESAGDYFEKYEYKFVFFGRFIPGVRSVIAVPAGLKGMSVIGFSVMTTIGALLWNIALVYAGYKLGDNYHAVEEWLGPVSKIVAATVFVVAIYKLYLKPKFKTRKNNTPQANE